MHAHTNTRTQISTIKTGEIRIRPVDCINVNIPLGYNTTVLQDVNTGKTWAKCTRDLSVLFLIIVGKSTIIAIKFSILK